MNKQQIIEKLEETILDSMNYGTDHDLERLPELLEKYQSLIKTTESKPQNLGQRLTAKVHINNWDEFNELINQVRQDKDRLEQSFEDLKAFVPDVEVN